MTDRPTDGQTDALRSALADRYAIERQLGEGGMATVYLAQDLKHRRPVAIKVLRPELAAALGPERFLREIEIAARLRHPHILPLHDSGEAAGFLFYVMPLVEGETLKDRLEREKQLPIDDAVRIAREVADALSYAHAHGVVHRDIKPANIMLESGHAVVADFGIARAIGSSVGAAGITETGMSVGTPGYMSPEQAAGSEEIDGRSDLYSLACVLYEMLAGQPPFTGATAEIVVRQHLAADPRPITQLRPAVPPDVAAAIQRALSKTPADRFNPAAQFADALTSRGATAGPTSPKPRLRLNAAAITGIVALLVAVTFGLAQLARRPSPVATDAPASIAVLPFTDLSGGGAEYLGDGIAETLINALSGVQGLKVASRTSAFAFKGTSEDIRAIGEKLGVRSVLEGSVQKAGDRLRVTAQLINTSDGFHLWSQNFDRDAKDIFAVQDEVARAVVGALQVRMKGGDSSAIVTRGTENLSAYDAYLLGRYYWNRRTPKDLELATRAFDAAIAADSNYALAWTGLAEAYQLYLPSEYNVTVIPWRLALERAEAAARRAITLDSTSAIAWSALGGILDKGNDGLGAARAFRRAIQLDPNYATAHQWYGGLLLSAGRADSGLAQMRRAAELDPASMVIGVEVGEALAATGRIAEASLQYERVVSLYPDAILANDFAWQHFGVAGDFERAAVAIGQLTRVSFGDSTAGREAETNMRDPARREFVLRWLVANHPSQQGRIAASIILGNRDSTVALLTRLMNNPDGRALLYMPAIMSLVRPPLSEDPRIVELFAAWRTRYYGAME